LNNRGETFDNRFMPVQRRGAKTMAARKSRVYIYVIDRDFGFAPNPYHGVCTLACCKYRIRSTAQVGDWVFGVGGSSLKATGRCIFGMQVTDTMSFEEYWSNPRYLAKRPVRNGSRAMMLGDNIYHRPGPEEPWEQENSHHSHPDGTPNPSNIETDTRTNKILASTHFVYFGTAAPEVPDHIFDAMGYSNAINHRVFSRDEACDLLTWFNEGTKGDIGAVLSDPFQFRDSTARYSAGSNKIIKEIVEPMDL